jgi:hypothetical protein
MALKVKIVSRVKPVSEPFSVSRVPTVGEFVETDDHPNVWHKISVVVHTPNGAQDAKLYSTEFIDDPIGYENKLFTPQSQSSYRNQGRPHP